MYFTHLTPFLRVVNNKSLAWVIASRMRTHSQTWHRPFHTLVYAALKRTPTRAQWRWTRPCNSLNIETHNSARWLCWHRQTSAPPVASTWTAEHVETSEESRISEAWLNYFASFISKMIKCTGYTTPILFKQYHTRRELVRQIREQWLFTNLRTPCGSHKLC